MRDRLDVGKSFLRNRLNYSCPIDTLAYFRIDNMESIENSPRDIHDYLNAVADGRLFHVIRTAGARRIAMQDAELFDLDDEKIREAERVSDELERARFKCSGQ